MAATSLTVGSVCWTMDENRGFQIVEIQKLDEVAGKATVAAVSHTFSSHVRTSLLFISLDIQISILPLYNRATQALAFNFSGSDFFAIFKTKF
jgi:hypothetical protein